MQFSQKHSLSRKILAGFCVLILAFFGILTGSNRAQAVAVGGGSSYNWNYVTSLSNNLNFGSGGLGALIAGGFAASGGTMTAAQLKALLTAVVKATVDPFFTGGSQSFMNTLLGYLEKSDPQFAAAYRTYVTSTNPQPYKNLETALANSSQVAQISVQAQTAALDISSKMNSTDKITMDQATIDQLINQTTSLGIIGAAPINQAAYNYAKEKGLDDAKAKYIAQQVAQHPEWQKDNIGYYTWKDANGDGIVQDSEKIRTSSDTALQNANNYLNGGQLKSDDTEACLDAFGPGGLNSSAGEDTSGSWDAVAAQEPNEGGEEESGGESGGEESGGGGDSGGNTTAVKCTAYTYSDWGACVDNKQSRGIITKTPANCSDTSSAVFKQDCKSPIKAVLVNITAATFNISNPVISLVTNRECDCQYNYAGGFVYGGGTNFETTGGYQHNTALANLTNGAKTYFAICKDKDTGGISDALKIDFTVNLTGGATTTQETGCAALASNDRKNDGNRSYAGGEAADSVYLWQEAETGTRDKFSKVDWYAGYQFSPEENGQITQVCGYFEDGVKNRVSIYNGAYKELAGAEVEGTGSWKCVNISPLAVKADGRYYVIARVEDNPIYFEYKSGIFPKSVNNAVIEAGVRQAAGDGDFGGKIRKYDHMIFGLVDIKITYPPANSAGPNIASSSPSGKITGTFATLAVQSSAAGECKFGRDDVEYGDMDYAMEKTTAGNFQSKVCNLEDGNYTFYVRCKDASGNANNASTAIQFEIE